MSDEYWSLAFPGLTERQALAIAELAEPIVDLGVIVLDPRTAYHRFGDRGTVDILVKCLALGIDSGTLDYGDRAGAESLLEDCQEWLAQASEEYLND